LRKSCRIVAPALGSRTGLENEQQSQIVTHEVGSSAKSDQPTQMRAEEGLCYGERVNAVAVSEPL